MSLQHHVFRAGEWHRAQLTEHPRVDLSVTTVNNHGHGVLTSRQLPQADVRAVTDTGAQSNLWSLREYLNAGFSRDELSPVSLGLQAANLSPIKINGAFFARLQGKTQNGSVVSCHAMIYVSGMVKGFFLSFETMRDLGIVAPDFPAIGGARWNPKDAPAGEPVRSVSLARALNAGCSARQDAICECPQRGAVPRRPLSLPFPCTPENNVNMREWLLDRFRASTFNTCPHRPLPCMSGPPVEIHLDAGARPRACHTPAQVPMHWQRRVYEDILRDEALGVIERVPYGEPVTWCHRMVVTRKHDGNPRRTVDLSPLNKFCRRETFASESPFHLARRIPGETWKTVTDAWNGYHSVPLRTSDRHLTTFITPFGRWRYTRAPQGFLSSGDGYNRRFDAVISDFERKERCVDDTIHYDSNLESHWWRTIDFLSTVGNAGIVLNPEKFQFAQREVDFAGFRISDTSIEPLPKYLDAIREFPTPTSTTDIRSWFGLVNQVANYGQLRDIMAPFKPSLSPRHTFCWTPALDAAFKASKEAITLAIRDGVKIFDVTKRTALRPDWSTRGIGYFLLQQHCSCVSGMPDCCPEGWRVTLAGSRFLSPAEQRYVPIEGEALAVAWGLEQTRYFTQGCNKLMVITDHKPLVKIFGDRTLDEITNTRLFRLKQRTLPWYFEIAHMPGTTNSAADATSRHPCKSGEVFGLGTHDLVEPAFAAAIRREAEELTAIPWQRVAQATTEDESMRALVRTVENGFPDTDRHLPHASPYWLHRHALYVSDGVVLYEDRIIIPPSLRRMVLENLHAAHQGVSSMELRARAIVFWPGITEDIHKTRAECYECNKNAPSQASLPSTPATPPSTPFEAIFADFFDFGGNHYLVVGDRLSGWTEIFASPSGTARAGATGLIAHLRVLFATFGVPEEISSDGGPEFTAGTTREFLARWGVVHRISSAYHPQSNGRAEVAVKSAKRLLRSNVGPTGILDNDKLLRALLQLRNTPDPDCNISPAQIVFGKPLRDTFSFVNRLEKFSNPNIRPIWREAWSAKESALRARFIKSSEKLNEHVRALRPLHVGDRCFVQNQTGNVPNKWDKTGTVVEVFDHDQYCLKMDGSGRVTTRNRKFLRAFIPASPTIRDLTHPPPIAPLSSDPKPLNTEYVPSQPKNLPCYPSPARQSPDIMPPIGTSTEGPPSTTEPLSVPMLTTSAIPPISPVHSSRNIPPESAPETPTLSGRPRRITRKPRIYEPETGSWS